MEAAVQLNLGKLKGSNIGQITKFCNCIELNESKRHFKMLVVVSSLFYCPLVYFILTFTISLTIFHRRSVAMHQIVMVIVVSLKILLLISNKECHFEMPVVVRFYGSTSVLNLLNTIS